MQKLGFEIFAFDLSSTSQDDIPLGNAPFRKVWKKSRFPQIRAIDFICKFFGTIYMFCNIKERIDVVQFHFLDIYYTLPLVIISKLKRYKISCFVYGSDFLRAGHIKKQYLKLIFYFANSIVCDSSTLLKKLQVFYPQFNNKFSCINFGSIIIDDLVEKIKSKRFPFIENKEKITVMCGYNGSKAQNHIEIINSISEYKDLIHLIIPMTYGCDISYIDKIRGVLETGNYDYELYSSYIPNEQWENIILSTDVFIHMQESDAFSSSLAEHLLLGHVVINADWLKYDDLANVGVYYLEANFRNLPNVFKHVITDYREEAQKHKYNRDKIVKLKSLSYCCQNYWVPYFSNLQHI